MKNKRSETAAYHRRRVATVVGPKAELKALVNLEGSDRVHPMKNLLTGRPNPRSKCARKTTRSPGLGVGTSSSPGTRKSRIHGILRARRSIRTSISVTLDPFQAPRWLPVAPSSPIEALEAVVTDGGEEDEETGGGASGSRREPRPPMVAEAKGSKMKKRGGRFIPQREQRQGRRARRRRRRR